MEKIAFNSINIKVPNEYINVSKKGDIIIRPPRQPKPPQERKKRAKRIPVEKIEELQEIDIVQPPETKPKRTRKPSFAKGSPEAIEFMAKLRSMKKK
jgi:hypothetical protein